MSAIVQQNNLQLLMQVWTDWATCRRNCFASLDTSIYKSSGFPVLWTCHSNASNLSLRIYMMLVIAATLFPFNLWQNIYAFKYDVIVLIVNYINIHSYLISLHWAITFINSLRTDQGLFWSCCFLCAAKDSATRVAHWFVLLVSWIIALWYCLVRYI